MDEMFKPVAMFVFAALGGLVVSAIKWGAGKGAASIEGKLASLSSDVDRLKEAAAKDGIRVEALVEKVGYLQAEHDRGRERVDGIGNFWRGELAGLRKELKDELTSIRETVSNVQRR